MVSWAVERRSSGAKTGILALASVALLCLAGCVSGGTDVISTAKVDGTGAIVSVSDETTVRDAVSSAELIKIQGQPLPWANASTGSAGVIDTIVENTALGALCRQFHTTRHAYNGISNYYGRACLVDGGNWQLLSFRPAG